MTNKSAYFPPEYRDRVHPDTFATKPFAEDYETRRNAFFDQVLMHPAPPQGSKGAFFEVARLAAGGQPDESVIERALTDFVDGRLDCADFVMQAVIRMLYQFGEPTADRGEETAGRRSLARGLGVLTKNIGKKAPSRFSRSLLDHAKSATLGFKYWPDEPGADSMCQWTENHQILLATAAFLAGQLYPDEIFINSGRSGREMMTVHRPRIDRWLNMRFQSGFSEWLSNVYYDEDWAGLLNLVDFAEDEALRERARMILDLSLLDMALNSFQGVFGSTHGRSYEQNKKWAALEGTTNTSKLLFGTGAYSDFDNMSVVLFALSENYRMPRVIYEIAHDTAALENFQRMGWRVQDADHWGLTYDDLESGMVFYSNEAYLHPKTAALTIRMFDEFRWWQNEFFKEFPPYRKFLYALRRLGLLPVLGRALEKDVCRNMRDEANIVTYRTPDYMLSTAQDHRAGYGGDQHHIWQATLGPNAVCFTTHPVINTAGTPNYWTGSGTLPRAAQVKNVVIVVYNISAMPGLYITNNLFYTHAWLPKKHFDEAVERDGWIFVCKEHGYLALRSQHPYRWVHDLSLGGDQTGAVSDPAKTGKTGGTPGEEDEIIVESRKNIWICELGRSKEDGSFSQFIEKISGAGIQYKGLSVQYDSPSQGLLEFGWRGSLKQNGQVIFLENYPRYKNPYCQAGFWTEEIRIHQNDKGLELDFATGVRTVIGGEI